MITERQNYAKQLKDAILVGRQLKTALENLNIDTTSVRSDIDILIDKLDKFDVYKQKIPYNECCAVCHEIECVCYAINPEPKTKEDNLNEEIKKLF